MNNPLSSLVPTDDREDGVYITVIPGQAIDVQQLIDAVEDAYVVNLDVATLQAVCAAASGVPERIGPPFQIYQGQFDKYLNIFVSDVKAIININSLCIADGVKLTVGVVICCLRKRGVRYGWKRDVIKDAIDRALYDTEICVAEASQPVAGEDGYLKYQIDLSPKTAPLARPDGTVDFREIQSFTEVVKDQLIARIVPPTPGKSGQSVTGREILPTPGNAPFIPQGKNTYVSEDGSSLLASRGGVIAREGNLLNIQELLTIRNDVDFSVGNIKYSGSLVINGSVKPGFVVEAEGDITVKGQVESAQVISRSGKVEIHQGIIGKSETIIQGKAGVHVSFAQGATLKTDGKLIIDRYALHCQLVCDVLEANQQHTSIVGGDASIYHYAETYRLGNDKGVETHISIVDKQKIILEESVKELDDLKKKLNEKLDPIKKQLQSKAAIMKKSGTTLTEKHRDEMKRWIDSYNAMSLKLKYVQQKIDAQQDLLRNRAQFYDGYVKVTGDIYPGVILSFYGFPKRIEAPMTRKTFRVLQGAVQLEG